MAFGRVKRSILLLAGVLSTGLLPTSPVKGQVSTQMYFPAFYQAYHPTGQITGRLLFAGAPEGGVAIDLVNYTVATGAENAVFTATSTATGDFVFDTPMALGPGEHYYLRYYNPTLAGTPDQYDTTRVLNWASFDLGNYAYDTTYDFADIDVSNIQMNLNAASVPVPYQFSWGRRAGYTSESYEYMLTDQASVFFQSGLLGYSDFYDLTALPTGFVNDTPYVWGIHIVSPTAGEGYSWSYTVMFGLGAPGGLDASLVAQPGPRTR